MSTMPTMYRKLSFSVPNDFEYLGMVGDVPMTLIARPDHARQQLQRLTAWIQQNKGKINLGNAGLGAASHLCGLMFKKRAADRHDRCAPTRGAPRLPSPT